MIEIDKIEEKLKYDERRLNAYKKYQKYEKMLEIYNNPADRKLLLKNTFNPFAIASKNAMKKDVDSKEFEAFCEKIDQLKLYNPNIELNTLYTHEGREIIGDIISDTIDEEFINADLESVAVAKCYGLYNSLNETQDKDNDETVKSLIKNQVPIPIYEKACDRFENYKKVERKELYDKIHKKNEGSQEIIHITAAALEIGPGEVEESLKAFDVIEGKKTPFDKYVNYDLDYGQNPDWYDMMYEAEAEIDKIMIDNSKTEYEKNSLINDQKKKIENIQKAIANVKNKNAEKIDRLERGKAPLESINQLKAKYNDDIEKERA